MPVETSSDVMTAAVAEWSRSDSGETKEFILELERPARTVRVQYVDRTRTKFSGFQNSNEPGSTGLALSEVSDSIEKITHKEPIILKSAGAIAFAATADELQEISVLPGVKAIRFNRSTVAQ